MLVSNVQYLGENHERSFAANERYKLSIRNKTIEFL